MGDGEGGGPLEVPAVDVHTLDGQLYALVAGGTLVGQVGRVAGVGRHLYVQEQVLGLGIVNLGRDVETVLEHRPVDGEVVEGGLLPLKVRRVKAAAVGCHRL